MKKPTRIIASLGATLLLVFVTAFGCDGSSSVTRAQLSEGCNINSDCASPLVCAFKRCHTECKATRDCKAPARCVAAEKPYRVCELSGERRECAYNSDCASPHVCAVDGYCRAECRDDRDCSAEQVCSFGTCADSDELVNGRLSITRPELAVGKQCILNSNCATDLVCVNAHCSVQCQTDIDCPTGSPCQNSACVGPAAGGLQPGATCDRSSQCTGDLVCVQRKCQVECEGTKDCALGQSCVNQRCVLPGGAGGDASSDATVSDGSMTSGDANSGDASPGDDSATVDGSTGVGCADGVKNGGETDVDCGGGLCPACGTGSACTSEGDCASRVCTGGRCVAATCNDGVKNGTEADVDCGGACSSSCAPGKLCVSYTDCSTGLCAGGRCRTAGCYDGVKNGSESDVDCGGPGCSPCPPTRVCTVHADCSTSLCTAGVCAAPTCSDTVRNGIETDIDCGGGVCNRCADTKACLTAADCINNNCIGGRCQPPSCSDGVKNDAETDRDCGGGACPRCTAGARCFVANDCAGGICEGGVCQAERCNDGKKTGTETDVDCGGAACPRCVPGKACVTELDCSSRRCFGGTCLETFILTVQKSGSGPGAVRALPEIDCGDTCSAIYSKDSAVTLTATPVPGSTFAGWGGPCTGTGACTVTMNQAQAVTAAFTAVVEDYTPLFSRSIRGIAAADIDLSGETVVVGFGTGTLDFGSGPLTTNGIQLFLARYASASGAVLWGRLHGITPNPTEGVQDLVVTGDGHPVVAGYRTPSYRFDITNGDVRGTNATLSSNFTILGSRLFPLRAPSTEAYLLTSVEYGCSECQDAYNVTMFRVRPDYSLVWTKTRPFGDGLSQAPFATDPSDNFFFAYGQSNGIVVQKYNSAGVLVWTSPVFGGLGGQSIPRSIGTDSRGDIYVSGEFTGQIVVNPSWILTAAGGKDAFLAKLSAADGRLVWARRFGTAANDESLGPLAMLPNDELIVMGDYRAGSAATFDGVSLPSRPAGYNWYLARFNASGTLLSARQPGDGTAPYPRRMRVSQAARKLIFVGAAGTSPITWGNGVTSTAATDYVTVLQIN